MGELVIKTHDFELAKNGLKEFSQKQAEDLEIDTVRTDGGFLGLGDHKVTGYELNRRLGTIQQHLIDLNTTNNRTIKEFGQVYSALEALDKDYIQAILISIKATEETSKRIEATQEQIKKIVEDQKKTLEVLKKFKKRLDGYAHLGDIDKIWNDCQKWHNEISSLSSSVSEAVSTGEENTKTIGAVKQSLEDTYGNVDQLSKSLSEQIDRIESVISFMNELEAITHLKDIDEMWDSLESSHGTLKTLCDELDATKQVAEKQQHDIEKSSDFVETVSKYQHLKDVDTMWDKVEDNCDKLDSLTEESKNTVEAVKENQVAITELVDYTQKLLSIVHLNDVDNLWESSEKHSSQIEELQNQDQETRNLIQHNKDLVERSFAAEKEKTDTMLQKLNKKIQYAYWIAGGSMALALIELLVILLR